MHVDSYSQIPSTISKKCAAHNIYNAHTEQDLPGYYVASFPVLRLLTPQISAKQVSSCLDIPLNHFPRLDARTI